MKSNFSFVLIKPQLGENIGSCARVLKNFGFSKLNIVEPKYGWPNKKARVTSVGAYDILQKVKVYRNTIDSLKKSDLVFSTTARKRDINKRHISMKSFKKLIKKNPKKKICIMFGQESSGLSNEDLSFSNSIIQIPTSKNFSSMNLSHAMAVVCYEIFKTLNSSIFNKESKFLKKSSKNSIAKFLNHLNSLLDQKNFFVPKEKKRAMLLNINNLFYRFEPSNKELRVLASIISSLSKKNINA